MISKDAPPSSTTTASDIALPWAEDAEQAAEVLHLVVAWCFDEPERLGETTPLASACLIGRGPPGDDPLPRAVFSRVRAGFVQARPPLSTRRISRQQLLCEPAGNGAARVRNTGRRALLHNGRPVSEATVHAGDTLTLQDTLVLLAEHRPRLIPRSPLAASDALGFEFGAPDALGLVGESPSAWQLRAQLAQAARADAHVLILGESGSGKELAAAAMHMLSPRAKRPFVARNAATLPESLVDAELFGNRENYPNVGTPMRPGLIGEANGGILFLDEIGELPERHQSRLLRVLDAHGEYQRLGDSKAIRSDFRLIAATNRPLSALKHDFLARFRMRLSIPGLNERRSDIPLLVRTLLRVWGPRTALAEAVGGSPDGAPELGVHPSLMDALVRHRYQGHVRELERLLVASASSSPGTFLNLTNEVAAELESAFKGDADAPSEVQIREALDAARGNKSEAAKLLGLKSRFALYRLLKKHDA